MLKIRNYRDIKITNIKRLAYGWCIHFFYEGNHYMLHQGWDNHTHLYDRNSYPINLIQGNEYRLENFILLKNNSFKLVYKQVDLAYFVYKLTEAGFAQSEFNYLVDVINDEKRKSFRQLSYNVQREIENEISKTKQKTYF